MGRTSDARDRLIEAGISRFWKKGFSGVSVDDLCNSAGVKKGSFYHFFESKEELALAALEKHWERRRPILDVSFSASVPPLERLERYFEFIFQRQSELKRETGHVLGCFYFSLGSASLEHPRIAERVREITTTYERYYESTLREAQSLGLVTLRDPSEKARSLFAYIEGLMASARIQNDVESLAHLGTRAFEFLGLNPPPREPACPDAVHHSAVPHSA